MKKIPCFWMFGFLAFWLLCSTAFAEYKNLPPEVQQNLSALNKYPKASSIVLWAEDDYVLRSDGSKTYERHEFRYLPDEASRDNWGDPRVNYVVGRDSLMILTARTYTRDGRAIDCTPNNAFNPVGPDGLDKAPDYAAYRQMVITLMGLENGCIAELHYRLNTAQPLVPWLEGRLYLRDENPTITRRLSVQVPEGRPLTYKVDRGAPEPAISGSTYTWTAADQPGYDKLDLQAHQMLLPNIAFTSAQSWEQVQTDLQARFKTALADDLVVPESLKKDLLGVSGDENRLDVIRAWAKARFNQVEFDHPDFALRLRPAKIILASGYGNGLELAALVCKLAMQSGVPAQVVPYFAADAPVPCTCDMTRALIALRLPGNALVYCDPLLPRSEFSSADLLGCYLLPLDNVKEPPFEFASKVKSPSIVLSLSLDGLKDDTLKGSGSLQAQGEFGMYEALRESDASDYLKQYIHLKGLTVSTVRIKDLESPRHGANVNLDFSFTAVGALDTVDRYHILPLSLLEFTPLATAAPLSLTSREFRQDVRLPAMATLHVEAVIPEGWQVKEMPRTLTHKWDFDQGTVSSEVKDGRFVFERTLRLSKEWIPPESWGDFRDFMLDSGKRPANAVVFAPKEEIKTAKK